MDIIDIEILEDGTIKFTTDKVSQANHKSADEFLKFVEEHTTTRKTTPRESKKHHHSHKHSHKH